jgi:hypothetical protein
MCRETLATARPSQPAASKAEGRVLPRSSMPAARRRNGSVVLGKRFWPPLGVWSGAGVLIKAFRRGLAAGSNGKTVAITPRSERAATARAKVHAAAEAVRPDFSLRSAIATPLRMKQ